MTYDVPFGDVVEQDGLRFRCVPALAGDRSGCKGCCLQNSRLCGSYTCSSFERKDGQEAIFEEVAAPLTALTEEFERLKDAYTGVEMVAGKHRAYLKVDSQKFGLASFNEKAAAELVQKNLVTALQYMLEKEKDGDRVAYGALRCSSK